MNNKTVHTLGCAWLALTIPWLAQAAGSVALTALNQTPAGGLIANGQPVTITVDATPSDGASIDNVYLVYRTLGGSQSWWVTNQMVPTSGVTWSGTIPMLETGDVDYFVACRFNGSETVATAEAAYTISELPSIESGRYMPFTTTWTQDFETNYFFNVDVGRWYASGSGRLNIQIFAPLGGTAPFYFLRSIAGAYIQSPPLAGGVGTIYLTSCVREPSQSGELQVQVSTNGTPSPEDWETVSTIIYPYANSRPNRATPITVNRVDVKAVRFLRIDDGIYDSTISRTDASIVFDNIVISKPPADIRIEERLRNPGYPARDQAVKMRCAVFDTNPDAPSLNHQVTVHYQRVISAALRPDPNNWSSVVMAPVGDGVYEGEIPVQETGFVYYYYRCAFDGYSYERDPDGPTGSEPTHNGNLSPNYWSDGETLAGPPVFYSGYEVRPFRSEYGEVRMDAVTYPSNDVPLAVRVPMELVGDEVWQGSARVAGLTNLSWYFIGAYRYTNDAPAYADEVEQWGDVDQVGERTPPIGGFAELNAATPIVAAEPRDDGFLLMRLNMVTGEYISKRAVYQNFNEWQASQTQFEAESLGLSSILNYTNRFDAWPNDVYRAGEEKYENDFDGASFDLSTMPVQTFNGWLTQYSRVAANRKLRNTDLPEYGLLLSGHYAGWFGNTDESMPEGLDELSLEARASVNDAFYAVYTDGFAFPHGQEITVNLAAENLSPGKPYISVLFNFKMASLFESSYYEFRLIQSDETSTQVDNKLTGEVWRWNAGSATPTKIGTTQAMASSRLLGTAKKLVITVSGQPNVTIVAKLDTSTARTFTDALAGQLTSGGTVGFLVHDAVPLITSIVVKDYPALATTLLNQTSFSDLTKWHLGGTWSSGGTRWTKNVDNKLTRTVPTQTVAVYTAPRQPGQNRADVNQLVKLTEFEVSSLSYQRMDIPMLLWDENFVEIWYDSGDVDVVIDEVYIYPWRAQTRGPENFSDAEINGVLCRDWTSTEQQDDWLSEQTDWAVLEGMVADSIYVRGRDVQFERSRANPALVQALVSPILTNGIGSLNFKYSVTGDSMNDRVVYQVDYTSSESINAWIRKEIYTNWAGQSGSHYIPIREGHAGRVRIRVNAASDPYAQLMIDDVEARDYPPRDETTWQAYNVMVTDLQTNRLYAVKTCYLNNSASNDVEGVGVVLDEHQPFIQSPRIETGIGEIAFWYRSWTGTTATELTLKVAPAADTPDAFWVTVTNLTVAPGTSFVYFQNDKIFDQDNHVLRIYGDTNGADRVCIDNILVAEPVRAGYEIQFVRLVPEQPLVAAPVAVEADIGRFLMNPKGIKLYLSYHVGSNVWGTANWWTEADTPGSRRIELLPVTPGAQTFRTPENEPIPAAGVDDVVQYYVWGTHEGIEGTGQPPIVQNPGAFVHPEWYWPVNLNTNYADQGFSPYYIVYSCPPGSVWVNEVSASPDAANEFIELIGPAQAHLGGWRIEMINYSTLVVADFCAVSNNVSLNSKTNGWGFFVWGDAPVANVNHVFSTVKAGNVQLNAGLHLFRSCGALEQKLCWGSSAKTALEPLGYTYAGNKFFLATVPFALQNKAGVPAGDTVDDFVWPPSGGTVHSPGAPNPLQVLAVIGEPPSGYVYLTSVISLHGLHDGVTTPVLRYERPLGGAAQIPYVADPWYRIGSFKSNGAVVGAAAGQSNYLWQVASMNADISNHVTFVAVEHPYGEHVPVDWLAQWSEGAVESGDADAWSVGDEYLLNTDPTLDTTASLQVTDVQIAGGTVAVTVKLDRDLVSTLGDINGTLCLQARASLQSGEFEDVANTAITGAQFGTESNEHTYTFENVTDPSRFFRAVIK